jgi:TMEM175 potassium channel family protein
MSDTAIGAEHQTGLSKHRLEGLTDGIFAVAMTLLVIELKVPEHDTVHGPTDLAQGVLRLAPIFAAWIISFFVLAIFWFSHHRLFHYVRVVDGRLLWLNIFYLGFVSLMPFSSALAGAYARMLFSQCFYSANMMLLALLGLLKYRHVFRHSELWATPMTVGFYRGARFRTLGLMVMALVAVGIAVIAPGAGNMAFCLMLPISIFSRRVEAGARS